jgi:glycyl-tRNA synthetase beta chain
MKKTDDFLVEIHTEELPPKALLKMAEAFYQQIHERLQKANLSFEDSKYFATPRRLAVFVKDLADAQSAQMIERKGPALSAAFDASGNPSPACVGFARSCNVTPAELKIIKSSQGEWVGFTQHVPGKTVAELLPAIVEQAALALPIPKRMRWGDKDIAFSRPIHSIMMLYGDKVIEGTILGYPVGRVTGGHRFHAPDTYTILHAAEYESLLRNEAYVIADFEARRSEILNIARASVELAFQFQASALIDHALLDEVTGLVEWPIALMGHFDKAFLELPPEVLISSMQDHQRYFPVVDEKQKLLPYFVTISNINSHDAKRVIHGNERVLRARLSDAAFFYTTDKKESLEDRKEKLKGIVFQAKLGTLYEKSARISQLAAFIAGKMGADVHAATQAGWLAKTDLTTNMVSEFPELQGVMGYYYALHDGLSADVASAIREQYLPRFAGDELPAHPLGQALALADRIDNLVGTFGINHIPTGDKDPYGLRRAALGVLRNLIEKKIDLDLKEVLSVAVTNYQVKLENPDLIPVLLNFMQERLRAWYQEQGISPDVFAAVAALDIWNPLDIHQRIQAVQSFKKLEEAEGLSVANKRVNNILSKYGDTLDTQNIDPQFFESDVEEELARQLDTKTRVATQLSELGKYEEVLLQLAELRKPVDDFFDQVMVMTDDKPRRENRILLLRKLRALFLQVADIALLQ